MVEALNLHYPEALILSLVSVCNRSLIVFYCNFKTLAERKHEKGCYFLSTAVKWSGRGSDLMSYCWRPCHPPLILGYFAIHGVGVHY